MVDATNRRTRQFSIAQLSDIHCGDVRFDSALIGRAISEIRTLEPDLIVVSGDLTANGYRDEFEQARALIDRLEDVCPLVVVPGNHDARNVGLVHFERFFGKRQHSASYPFTRGGGAGDGLVRVVAVDSTRPDVNDGEVGRQASDWIVDQFAGDYAFRLFVLHHHLVAVPGTGRERSVVLDGGDVMWNVGRSQCDLALSGHKHVPWVWAASNSFIVTSGTAGTRRLRGNTPPSYNVVSVTADEFEITFRNLEGDSHLVQRFERRPRYRHIQEMVCD